MMNPPPEEMLKISSLQWLTAEQIKAQFSDILQDARHCKRVDVLRSIVIYRIQEKYYDKSVSAETKAVLEKAVAGDLIYHAPADDLGKAAKKLVRNYKGVDYEVLLYADGSCEMRGQKYRSLTSVAKAITGTHWNGPQFFGVKK